MKTNFSNNAMGIYWDAVNLMTAEYRDVLVDLKRIEDNCLYGGYSGYVALLGERETIIDNVRTKLGISKGLVYGLDNELVDIDIILEWAESYVSSSCKNVKSYRANQIFWNAVDIIDREYGDILRLLDEHLDILELVNIPEYNTWMQWYGFKSELIKEIEKKFNTEYNLTSPNEIIVDEYGRVWNYDRLISRAINHIGRYIPWEDRIRNKEKEEGSVDWKKEYRCYVTPH
jgi:hypothetical protein